MSEPRSITLERVNNITKEHTATNTPIKTLCKKYKLHTATYYKYANTTPQKVIDLPLKAHDEFVIICRAQDARRILENL